MSLQHSPKIVTDGLVLALDAGNPKSYRGSGTVWTDLSGNNNSGSLTNSPVFDAARLGNLTFNGSTQYGLVSTGQLGASLDNGISVSVWCNTTTTATLGAILGVINTGTSMNLGITLNNGAVGNPDVANVGATQFLLRRDGSSQLTGFITASTSQTIYDGNWHNLTWSCAPITGIVNVYVDAVSAPYTISSTFSGGGGFVNFDRPLAIGARNNRGTIERFANVQLANVQIYNKVLSAQEVLQNFNATRGRFGL